MGGETSTKTGLVGFKDIILCELLYYFSPDLTLQIVNTRIVVVFYQLLRQYSGVSPDRATRHKTELGVELGLYTRSLVLTSHSFIQPVRAALTPNNKIE